MGRGRDQANNNETKISRQQRSVRQRSGEESKPDIPEEITHLPVIEENLNITRRKKTTGVVHITKKVHERVQRVDEPVFHETVDIERIPVNQVIQKPAVMRQEGDTTIIPLMEEELVVEKRLVLKEEIRITKRREQTRDPKQVALRSEEVNVERKLPDQLG